MKLNDFNSKLNLPKLCAKMGLTDYQFKFLPIFGWYAYNKDMSFVGNVFDIVGLKEQGKLFSLVTKDKVSYLDFAIPYNETAETTLYNNLIETQLWSAAFLLAEKEMDDYITTYKGKRCKLKDALNESGYSALLSNRVGVVTQKVLDRFNMLKWSTSSVSPDIRGMLLIPTFCTPRHICSLEICRVETPEQRNTVYLNSERGWYGNIKHKTILPSMRDIWSSPGITWDKKLDYWNGDQPYDFSPQLITPDYIKIWAEAQYATFTSPPLEKILESNKDATELAHYVGLLSVNQLNELEERTGKKYSTYWRKARETQVQIGKFTYVKRDNSYYQLKKGVLEPITNFSIEINKIVRRGTKFFRIGIMRLGEKSAPFEIAEESFNSSVKLKNELREKFIAAGVGIPIIYSNYNNVNIVVLIESFNASPPIELESSSEDSNPIESLLKNEVGD